MATSTITVSGDVRICLQTFGNPADPALGELAPPFPSPHGEAVTSQVPGARAVVLPTRGHDLLPHGWDTVVDARVGHAAP